MLRAASAAVTCLTLMAASADAQVRAYPRGVGSVSVGFQHISNEGHRLTDGFLDPGPGGLSVSRTMVAEAAFGVTDRLTLGAGLPFVSAKYTGGDGYTPFPLQPADADGRWHGSFQDIGLSARYEAVSRGRMSLTPAVALLIPSHAYAYRGEAVVGRRLRELQLSLNAALTLDAISPRLSVDGSYGYAVVEKPIAVPNNRSTVTVGAGFLVTPKLHATGALRFQRTHGGLRAGSPTSPIPGEIDTPVRIAEHDRLLRDNHVHLEGGLSYSLAAVDLYGSYLHYLSGTDTHAGHAITVAMTYFFGAVR